MQMDWFGVLASNSGPSCADTGPGRRADSGPGHDTTSGRRSDTSPSHDINPSRRADFYPATQVCP